MTKEIENVLKIDFRKKYEYFIKKVVDWEVIWSLSDSEGFVTVTDDSKVKIPLWPKKDFAEFYIADDWECCKPVKIDLYEFLDEWIPNMKENRLAVSIFWHNDGKGIDVDPDDLVRDLRMEMEKY